MFDYCFFSFQWLICYALNRDFIPVLPSFLCSWTDAAQENWQLPQRCSWYMRYKFPSEINYRDHSFLRKFMGLSTANASFVVRHSQMSSLSLSFSPGRIDGSQGSIVIMNPTFWLETQWSQLVRDYLTFLHGALFSFEDLGALGASQCASVQDNPRSGGCC